MIFLFNSLIINMEFFGKNIKTDRVMNTKLLIT